MLPNHSFTTAGVLHPGTMGVTVATAVRHAGIPVLWASEGRSPLTRRRAAQAGLSDGGTVAAVAAASDVVFSVCPPDVAADVARAVADAGFTGVFVDANAVAPGTVTAISAILTPGGADLVDGGIIGPPAHRAGTTRLYLSGDRAGEVAALLDGALMEPVVIGADAGQASALKMCYAAYTKGSAALLLDVCALAGQTGVTSALQAEWQRSQPDLLDRAAMAARGAAPKAWRWTGEMDEIAATFAAAGLPDGFHVAARRVFERLSCFKDDEDVPLEAVLSALSVVARPP